MCVCAVMCNCVKLMLCTPVAATAAAAITGSHQHLSSSFTYSCVVFCQHNTINVSYTQASCAVIHKHRGAVQCCECLASRSHQCSISQQVCSVTRVDDAKCMFTYHHVTIHHGPYFQLDVIRARPVSVHVCADLTTCCESDLLARSTAQACVARGMGASNQGGEARGAGGAAAGEAS